MASCSLGGYSTINSTSTINSIHNSITNHSITNVFSAKKRQREDEVAIPANPLWPHNTSDTRGNNNPFGHVSSGNKKRGDHVGRSSSSSLDEDTRQQCYTIATTSLVEAATNKGNESIAVDFGDVDQHSESVTERTPKRYERGYRAYAITGKGEGDDGDIKDGDNDDVTSPTDTAETIITTNDDDNKRVVSPPRSEGDETDGDGDDITTEDEGAERGSSKRGVHESGEVEGDAASGDQHATKRIRKLKRGLRLCSNITCYIEQVLYNC